MPGALDIIAELRLTTNDSEVKELNSELNKSSNLVKEQEAAYKRLESAKLKANNAQDLKAINAEQAKLNGLMDRTVVSIKNANNEAAKFSKTLESIKQGFIQGLGVGAGFGLAGFIQSGVTYTKQFIAEASKLAAETEGVKRAFDRLNEPNLLQNLREATRGTVSDLELMKQAVQFNNFGLPLNQLATGLEFARIRAKETGQSVEYLVQSIVTGVGRQSPLILDNLGISARRVSEEFKRTGDFAQAAFKIIQEETAKSGEDLETYAERIAKIGADVDNFKAKFGEFFNIVSAGAIEVGRDISENFGKFAAGGLLGTGLSNFNQYLDALEEAKKRTRELAAEQEAANQLFNSEFKRFADQYASADLDTRKKIESQADAMYQSLIAGARSYYGDDLNAFNTYSNYLKQGYLQLTRFFGGTKLNLNTLQPGQLAGLSREQLSGVLDQIGGARNALTAGDTNEINRLNRLEAAAKKLLSTINGTDSNKSFAKASREAEKFKDKIDALTKAIIRSSKLAGTEEEREALRRDLDEYQKLLTEASERIGKVAGNALADGIQSELEKSITGGIVDSAEDILRQLNEQERKAREKREKEEKERSDRAKSVDKTNAEIEFYATEAAIIAGGVNAFLDAEQRKTAILISEQEKRVDRAKELAKEGNAAILKEEEDRLARLEQRQEENRKKQEAINAALVISQQAVNIADAIGAVIKSSDKSNVITLIATLAAATGAIFGTVSTIKEGFYKGGYTGDGDPTEVAGVVHKREVVFDHKSTSKLGKDNLEKLRAGKAVIKEIDAPPTLNYQHLIKNHGEAAKIERQANSYDMHRLEDRMKELIEAYNSSGGVHVLWDENNMRVMADKMKIRQMKVRRML